MMLICKFINNRERRNDRNFYYYYRYNYMDEGKISILKTYGEDLTSKVYVTDPSISREEELKKLMIVLLTPEKSGLLVGKAGIGKTAIVEGLSYRIGKQMVPNALMGYRVAKINSSSLVGKLTYNGKEELVISILVEELKKEEKLILFIDEIHTLIGGSSDGPMDLANILKPVIDRGDVKIIGATTDIEYNTYIVRDRAFLRRFERIDVLEPTEKVAADIVMGSLPKIEKQTGIKFRYNEYVTRLLVESIVSATNPYKRVYGLGAMYPDICFSVVTAAFSNALYNNRPNVGVEDVYMAIKNSKRIYPDSIIKELNIFREKFNQICIQEGIQLPIVTIDEVKEPED